MSENRKLKVFLCHSHDDKLKVQKLYHRLVADGFDVWLDEERLIPGQDWDFEIRKAVRQADVVIVCLSSSSVTKAGYVQKEIHFALDIADEQPEGVIFIIPTQLEGCEVPSRLTRWQWVNLSENRGLEKLILALTIRANAINAYIPAYIEPQMIKIPASKFLMGTSAVHALQAIKNGASEYWIEWEQPQHTVELSEYSISKYPITNREYYAFVRDAKYAPPHSWGSDFFPAEKGEHPVVNVTWNDATAYCNWLSKKSGKRFFLPTEAQWEKAARGEQGLVYPWGNEFDSRCTNTKETMLNGTSEVGQFSPQGDSPYGCADMIGNVWEWCSDWFDENEYKQRQDLVVKNPLGSQTGRNRVLRGGSFYHDWRSARCGYRNGNIMYCFNNYIGFRVASS